MSPTSLDITVPAGSARPYAVRVGDGHLDRLGSLVAEVAPAHRYVLIADADVAALYAGRTLAALRDAGLGADLLTFPAGEASKSRATWGDLCERMLGAGAGRDAAVVALGGGVTGDLAGFVAATYMRGIPVVMVPTSLLAMIDSSIGGKTGIDVPGGKNAIGAFHPPRLVVVDPGLLRTLPPGQFAAGLAEAVKIAVVADEVLFERLEAAVPTPSSEGLGLFIDACIRLKAGVVERDPYEMGERQVLNFGHTAGHALEVLTGYARPHGEAVALGMRIEARLGEAIGVTEPGTAARIDTVLDACGLPVAPDGADPDGEALNGERLLAAAASDKKARRNAIRWVLPRRIGEVARDPDGAWSREVDPAETRGPLDAVLDALRESREVADSAS